ncbi:MAG: transglycosylase domain-containing protein [Clostridia bacterium]|nr:transglycosylase domain-containing protein [Clostridia bacterium]
MKNREKNAKPKKRGTVGRILMFILNAFLTVMLVGIITAIIVGSAFAIYVKNNVDIKVDETKFELNTTNTTTKLFYYEFTDRENRIGEAVELEDARLYGGSNSIFVPYSQIPKDLINAFVAIEDKRFWDHKGVDWYRTVGAGANFFLGFQDEFGASTITQQLIKNITGEDDYKIQRKIQEIFWALDLESKKSKEDILTLYLNVINLSQNCYGVQAAANTYFGKDVSELTLLECACIAAITNNPSYYNPIRFPEHNKERRQTILWQMYKEEMISEETMNELYDLEPEFNLTTVDSGSSTINSWYTDMVINDVIDALVDKGYTSQAANLLVYSGGLNIYTCIDPDIQAVLDEVYTSDEYFPEHTSGMPAQSSMIIIDPNTGDILGVAGAKGEKKGNRIQNFATDTVRPAGSSIKPVSVYGPALENGLITYATVYDDTPVNFRESNTSPWPHNLPDVYGGLTNVNSAIERSVNTIAIKVLEDLTTGASFDFCRDKLGMTSLIELVELSNGGTLTDIDYAPLALGQLTYGCTVREITAAYTAFANDGVFNSAHSFLKVTTADGEVLLSNEDPGNIVFSEENAAIMTQMLSNVVNNGTAKAVTLRKTVDCAGKTGTTNNDYDRWFIGYTPYFIGGVWYGYEYPKTLSSLKSNPCVSIWDTVMTKLHQSYIDEAANGGEALKEFETPGTVIKATYCKDSGMLMTDACRADPRGSRAETGYFAVGTQPNSYCTTHVLVDYCTDSGAVASACCPDESITQVGLIEVTDRSFPVQITVTDAQYVYRELPESTEPGGWWGDPFFINAIPSGTYVGSSNVETQYNQFCWKHFDFDAFNRGEITSSGRRVS